MLRTVAKKRQIIRHRLCIQCDLHERERAGEITPLIDKSFSFFGAGKWKLKEGEQGCSEPIVAGLTVIGSERGPASCGLIWEFTGASRISLRHISLMSLSTAWIRRFYTSKLYFPSADRNCNRYPEGNMSFFPSLFLCMRDTGCIASTPTLCTYYFVFDL